MIDYLLTAIFGLVVGFAGGYTGIGGAPLLIFLFTTFLDFPQHVAQGTVVAIMLGPMSLTGLIAMRGRIRPLLRFAIVGILTYAGFSYLGAWLAYFFTNQSLRLLFAILLILLGIYSSFHFLLGGKKAAGKPLFELKYYTMTAIGALLGLAGGFFGIGAGVLLVPLLTWFFKMDKDDARTLSLLILLPPVSVGAVIKYQLEGDIVWLITLTGFCAYFISNYWGARLGRYHGSRVFQAILGILLFLMGCIYLFMH